MCVFVGTIIQGLGMAMLNARETQDTYKERLVISLIVFFLKVFSTLI